MFLVGHMWTAATDTRMSVTAPDSLQGDFVQNRQTLNRISKSPKSNQISNRSDENRIFNGEIESREAIQSRFKSNRDWDLPITVVHSYLLEPSTDGSIPRRPQTMTMTATAMKT